MYDKAAPMLDSCHGHLAARLCGEVEEATPIAMAFAAVQWGLDEGQIEANEMWGGDWIIFVPYSCKEAGFDCDP